MLFAFVTLYPFRCSAVITVALTNLTNLVLDFVPIELGPQITQYGISTCLPVQSF